MNSTELRKCSIWSKNSKLIELTFIEKVWFPNKAGFPSYYSINKKLTITGTQLINVRSIV